MKNKTSLVLLEQIIMVAVFALAAAVCVRAFVWADATSRDNQRLDAAVMDLQNAAEYLKHTGGDLSACAETFGGAVEGERWICPRPDYTITATALYPNMQYLGSVALEAADPGGAVLVSFTVNYQEVTGHG